MKFESKFGLGEIVVTQQRETKNGVYCDRIAKVVAVQFDLDGRCAYLCRIGSHGQIVAFTEPELIGDPDFDQERGYTVEAGASAPQTDAHWRRE